ncbi:iron-hydroxamate ABC transporter substrate-binding protein [Lentibacillus sediminis]|uniref:iron-hydroxamate ABC transporter substrate-binding protein n=1 Tax=Lentibacillus sediminis TaxID=1940529 RepID=UPI000C1BA9A0|nr:iron-hydroxamate ABC transporter substrate-binding protein [Lentibacillus sediminis]
MNANLRNRLLYFLIPLTLLLLLAACGGNNDSQEETEQDNNTEETGSSEITMESEMGEVTISADPERVLAPYNEDTLLALGVQPVAKWAIGESVQTYLEDELSEVPSIEWTLPLEQVLSHEPDLIILENNMENYEGTYEDYNSIAPTYVMSEEMTSDWRMQLETFGEMLGKEEEAEAALNDYEQKVADASETINQAIGDETVAAIWATGDQFFLFEQDRHSAEVLYSELGINVPAYVEDLGEAGTTWNPISIEALSELDADHVFLLAEEGVPAVETLENSSVWQSTPAAENSNVYRVEDPSNWTNKGLIASEQTINDVLEALAN